MRIERDELDENGDGVEVVVVCSLATKYKRKAKYNLRSIGVAIVIYTLYDDTTEQRLTRAFHLAPSMAPQHEGIASIA